MRHGVKSGQISSRQLVPTAVTEELLSYDPMAGRGPVAHRRSFPARGRTVHDVWRSTAQHSGSIFSRSRIDSFSCGSRAEGISATE